jgi:hypothetical protein
MALTLPANGIVMSHEHGGAAFNMFGAQEV